MHRAVVNEEEKKEEEEPRVSRANRCVLPPEFARVVLTRVTFTGSQLDGEFACATID